MSSAVWIGAGILVAAVLIASALYFKRKSGAGQADGAHARDYPVADDRRTLLDDETIDPFANLAHPAEAMERAVRGAEAEEPEQKQEKKLDLKLATPPPRPPGR